MPGAGELDRRIAFQQREIVSDNAGNVEGDFADVFTVWAGVRALVGGEQVMAARLSGRQPVVIRVRQTADTLSVDADWRARDVDTGTLYAITSPPHDPDNKRLYLEMLATSGIAA